MWPPVITFAGGVLVLIYWACLRFTDSPRVRRWADHPLAPPTMRYQGHTGFYFVPPMLGVALLLFAMAFTPQMPPEWAVGIILTTLGMMGILVAIFGYRRVLPLWIYPPWLRDLKRQERDEIRANRWWKRDRRT